MFAYLYAALASATSGAGITRYDAEASFAGTEPRSETSPPARKGSAVRRVFRGTGPP